MILNLYVIGNGFDCYKHNLPTKYQHFKSYILDMYPNCGSNCEVLPSVAFSNDADIMRYFGKEVAGYIVNIIDSCGAGDWAEFESYLGEEIFSNFLWDIQEYTLEEDDKEIFHKTYNNEDVAQSISNVFMELPNLFNDWVKSLKTLEYTRIPEVSQVLDRHSLYLTFNYTFTLEKAYDIPSDRICHIHGICDDERVVLGHGDDSGYSEPSNVMGIEHIFSELKTMFRKDTFAAINKHRVFFEGIKNSTIDSIYSIGFSFSNVDMVYIEEISRCLDPTKTKWFFDSYYWNYGSKEIMRLIEHYGYHIDVCNRW